MNTASAIVFPAANAVEVQTYELPDLRPGELRVRTLHSGVSQGTEVWALTGRRGELTFPTVPGYQAVGIVEEVGPEAKGGLAVGQDVWFKSGRLPDHLPPTWMGAHVSRALVNEALPLPDDVDPVAASLAALAAVSLRGINMLRVGIGDLVVVTGQGMIGQGSALLARLRGATVVAADLSPTRLALSRQYGGADVTVDVRERSLAEVVRALKPGGADAVIETTGRSDQFAPCIDLLREQGQILLQGYYPDPITFDFFPTHLKRPLVAVTCGFDLTEVATCLRLMGQNKLPYQKLVTHHVPFGHAPTLYPRLASGDPDILGVVWDWTGAVAQT